MTNYARGAAFERRVVAKLEAAGWLCVRAAGSHGVADVVALRGTYNGTRVMLIECKTGGVIPPATWDELYSRAQDVKAWPVLATNEVRGGALYRLEGWSSSARLRADRMTRIDWSGDDHE